MERAESAKHAWRSKPRQFAPKSRLGCKTCKIRRVKCDLARPSCLKCQSTGRTCDGYNDPLLVIETERNPSDASIEAGSHEISRGGTNTTREHQQCHAAETAAQPHAMRFFEHVSIAQLNKYQPCDEWRKTLMFFSQTVPSVRHAATALALLHQNYQGDGTSDYETALLHYNHAIHLVLKSTEPKITPITLLVCYLFICFEHLAGNDVQAMTHLRGGVELSRSLDNNDLVTRRIRSLDKQAVMFQLDWTPDIHEPAVHGVRSLNQAAEHLQTLVAQAVMLRNTEQRMFPTGKITAPPSNSIRRNILLGELETWWGVFGEMPLTTLLRLQYKIAWILVRSYDEGLEMEYDAHLEQFQTCVALASDVAAAHFQAFTPEIGILPILYIIGVKCRHPVVRREALSILQRHPMREAVWNSSYTARVLQRVIEIEEEGNLQSMAQIPISRRIEALSWLYVGGDRARLDITYTFCAQEGTHTETLVI